jgi:hypothetical protein
MTTIDVKIETILKERYKNETPSNIPIPPESDVLYNGKLGLLVVPRSVKGISTVAKRTIWCISDPRDTPQHNFYTYPENVYVFVSPKLDVYAWNVNQKTGKGKFITQHSHKYHGITGQSIRDIKPIGELFDLLESEVIKDPVTSYNYSVTMIQKRWEKGEKIIAKDDKYFKKYLHFLRKRGETFTEREMFIEWKKHSNDDFLIGWFRKKIAVLKSKIIRT